MATPKSPHSNDPMNHEDESLTWGSGFSEEAQDFLREERIREQGHILQSPDGKGSNPDAAVRAELHEDLL